MNYLIIYERKNRELENAILLKIELEKRGNVCDVSQFYESSKFSLLKNKYDVIIVPHFYSTESVYRVLSRFGKSTQIFNLQYEQVLSKKWEEVGHHNPKLEAKKVTHMCWGTATQQRLLSAKVSKDNLPLFSPLHLDLLRPQFRPDNLERKKELSVQYGIDKSEKWNLFISSFTFADILDGRLKMNEEVAGIKLSGFRDIHSQSRRLILQWFRKALDADKKSMMIYRPHPDELNLSAVKELEKEYPNFRIVNELSVKEWIIAADHVYSWYSTSIVESHFLGKPYGVLRPNKLPDFFDSVLIKKASFIESMEEFIKYYLGKKELTFALKNEDVNDYYIVDQKKATFKLLPDFFEKNVESSNLDFDVSITKKFKAYLTTFSVIAMYTLFKLSKKLKIDLEKYNNDITLKRNFFINWFLEFDAQVASASEIENIETRMKAILEKSS